MGRSLPAIRCINLDAAQCYRVVLAGALFVCLFLTYGIAYCVGIFQKVFVEEFNNGSGLTSWVGSINQGVACAAGPLASWLIHQFGMRFTIMLGGLLATTGFIVTSMATDLIVIMFAFGAVTGLGYGLVFLTVMVAVVQHFPGSSRTLVQSVVLNGIGIGTFIYPFIVADVTEKFGWRGSMLITAGITLHVVLAGAFVREPASIPGLQTDVLNNQVTTVVSEKAVILVSIPDELQKLRGSRLTASSGYLSSKNISILSPDIYVSTSSLAKMQNYKCKCEEMSNSQPSVYGIELQKQPMSGAEHDPNQNLVDYNRVIKSGHIYHSDGNWEKKNQNDRLASSTSVRSIRSTIARTGMLPNGIPRRFHFYCSISFWLLFISAVHLCLAFLTFFTHIVAYSMESCGLDEVQASMLVSTHGLVSIVGRVLMSLVMMRFESHIPLYILCVGICALVTFLMTVWTSFEGLMVCTVIHGMTSVPAYGPILSEVCLLVVGKDHYAYGYGTLMVAMAAGLLIGPPCAGWIYDASHVYANSFYLATASSVFSTLWVLPIIFWPKRLLHTMPVSHEEQEL